MKKTESPTPDRRRALLRSLGSWALTIGLAAAVFVGVNEWRRASLMPDGEGKPAPDVTLLDLDGQPVALSSFRGKAVMLHFWGPW